MAWEIEKALAQQQAIEEEERRKREAAAKHAEGNLSNIKDFLQAQGHTQGFESTEEYKRYLFEEMHPELKLVQRPVKPVRTAIKPDKKWDPLFRLFHQMNAEEQQK